MFTKFLGFKELTEQEVKEIFELVEVKKKKREERATELEELTNKRLNLSDEEREEKADAYIQTAIELLADGQKIDTEIREKILAITERGTQRYIEKSNDEEKIKADALTLLNKITYEDIINFRYGLYFEFKDNPKMYDEEMIQLLCVITLEEQRRACNEYLFENTLRFILQAANERAKELYDNPPTAEEEKALIANATPFEYIYRTTNISAQNEQAQPVEKKQPLAVLEDLIKSKSYTVLNSKIVNSYANLQDYLSIESNGQLTFIQELQPIRISPQKTAGTQQDVITLVNLDYSGDLPAKLAKISPYDKTVLNTLCSIWEAGNTTTTINSIFKVMNGNTDREPRANQRKKLMASLNKLSDTKIFIDFSDEIKKSYIVIDEETDERFISGTVSDRLFNFRVFTAETSKGRKVEAIQFLTEPVLLTYSKIKKNVQLVTFPTAMLDTKSLNATDSVIVIREYLAKQITLMKNKRSNIILYDTLYRECGIELPEDKNRLKTETKRYRDSIDAILTEWKEQGYIKNFKAYNTGRKCTGVELYL